MADSRTNGSRLWAAVTLVAVLLLGAVAIISLYHTQTGSAGSTAGADHMITIDASGSALAQPSQAVMYLTVNGTGPTTQNAVANLSATMQAVNQTLYQYSGFNYSNIATVSYDVEAVCNYTSYAIAIGTGYGCASNSTAYEAVEGLSVTLPNVTSAGDAVKALSSIPDVEVSSVEAQFSPAQVTALRPQALSEALANATSQAEATIGTGYNLSVENITVSGPEYAPYPLYAASSSATGSAITPIIYPGNKAVTESMTVVFSYRKAG